MSKGDSGNKLLGSRPRVDKESYGAKGSLR